ncbi:MAG: ribonuclease H-like domain-containing protein [archaeon]|nr:ribonuclease H-like domain-containing protein [archaeon]
MAYNKVTGLLLEADYKVDEQGNCAIQIFVSNDKKIEKYEDPDFKPYFHVIVKDPEKTIKAIENADFGEGIKTLKVEKAEKENAKNVLRVYFKNPQDLIKARETVEELEGVIEKREFDIPFANRYLIDKKLKPMSGIEIEEENGEIRKIVSKEIKHELRICAIDLETYSPGRFSDPQKDPILMAVLSTKKESIVYTYKKTNAKNTVVLKNEKELVKKIIDDINEMQPDILVTYNGDSFDMPYIKTRCEKLKLDCKIGHGGIRIFRKGMYNATSLKGIQHLDAFQLVKFMARIGAISLLKFDLENVSEKLFGKPKEKVKAEEINELWDKGTIDRVVEYNREDGAVTVELAEEFLPLQLQLTSMLRMSLHDTSRASSSQMVEQLLIVNSFDKNALIPNKPRESEVNQRNLQTYQGGFVKEPLPGLHENIAVLDFRSLHPTIMISHNISLETLKCNHAECKKGKNLSPDKDWFCEKEKGFLSGILEEILNNRIKIKGEMKKFEKGSHGYKMMDARQHALKILLNSHYGYLGYPRARWYSRESARAVTAWSRHYIQNTMEKANERGFKTLYGDSVTRERNIVLKNPSDEIEIRSIEEFYNQTDVIPAIRNGKTIKPCNGYSTLSINSSTLKPEWKKVKEIIRHKSGKKIYRINQKFGETCVTEDHSILIEENENLVETKATELKGKKLFSADIPKEKNYIKEIDLYKILNEHYNTLKYKGRIKLAQFHADKSHIWFGWTNRKHNIKLKRKIKIDSPEFESLCRLFGAYIAEGSSSTYETTSTRIGASISSSNKPWLQELSEDYNRLFAGANVSIIRSAKGQRTLTYTNSSLSKTIQYEDNTMKLQLMNQISAMFFKIFCGQKSIGKMLPNFIFNVPDKYKKLILEKMIEGDGSRSVNKKLGYTKEYIKNNFSYTTKSLKLISGLSVLLKQLGQNYTINYRPSKQAYTLKTSTKHNNRIKTKITEEKYNGFVYDLSVQDNNNFVDACGQILLHNTDSLFILVPKEKGKKEVVEFVEEINSKLPGAMELEFEGFFKRGIFVTKKEGGAAKKKYALVDFEGNLKIVGFEYVRRDWSTIAKETQKSVIEAVLKEGNPEKAIALVRKVISELKTGKVPKKDLVIMTQLKRKIDKYDSIGPHVAAAKKAIERGKEIDIGSVLGFIITKGAGKRISDTAELEEYVEEGNYDSDYYIKNQIIPAVIKIMRELGYEEEDLIQGGKQSSLSAFT